MLIYLSKKNRYKQKKFIIKHFGSEKMENKEMTQTEPAKEEGKPVINALACKDVNFAVGKSTQPNTGKTDYFLISQPYVFNPATNTTEKADIALPFAMSLRYASALTSFNEAYAHFALTGDDSALKSYIEEE